MEKKALGRGLGALFEGPPAEVATSRSTEVEVNRISPNRFQPRKAFDEDSLEELTESVARTGILQPVLLRKQADGPRASKEWR